MGVVATKRTRQHLIDPRTCGIDNCDAPLDLAMFSVRFVAKKNAQIPSSKRILHHGPGVDFRTCAAASAAFSNNEAASLTQPSEYSKALVKPGLSGLPEGSRRMSSVRASAAAAFARRYNVENRLPQHPCRTQALRIGQKRTASAR